MHPWTRTALVTGLLLNLLWVGYAPGQTRSTYTPEELNAIVRNHTNRASQEELDALDRRKRMSPAGRQADAEYQARQRAQQEQERNAAIEARHREEEAKRQAAILSQPKAKTLHEMTVEMCEHFANASGPVVELRHLGIALSTALLVTQTRQKDPQLHTLMTNLIAQVYRLPNTLSVAEVHEQLLSMCLLAPEQATGLPFLGASSRY